MHCSLAKREGEGKVLCRYSEHHSFALSSEEEEAGGRVLWEVWLRGFLLTVWKKGGGEAGAGSIYNEAERTCKRAFTLNINHEACWGKSIFLAVAVENCLIKPNENHLRSHPAKQRMNKSIPTRIKSRIYQRFKWLPPTSGCE